MALYIGRLGTLVITEPAEGEKTASLQQGLTNVVEKRDVERKKELEGCCKIREQGEKKPRENLRKKLCDDPKGCGVCFIAK
jgi:hypothetical protein